MLVLVVRVRFRFLGCFDLILCFAWLFGLLLLCGFGSVNCAANASCLWLRVAGCGGWFTFAFWIVVWLIVLDTRVGVVFYYVLYVCVGIKPVITLGFCVDLRVLIASWVWWYDKMVWVVGLLLFAALVVLLFCRFLISLVLGFLGFRFGLLAFGCCWL